MVLRLNDIYIADRSSVLAEVDMRSEIKRETTFRGAGTLYGEPPCDERLWLVSPYEFVSDRDVVMLSYPQSTKYAHHTRHHAELTPA